jgi:citrate synthase
MAGILCDLEFPPELANALFIGSRMFGVLRHAIEEQTMPPMRRIDPTSHVYTGPPTRSLPKEY